MTGLTHSHELMEEQVLFCHTHTQTPVIVNTLYTFTDSRQSNSCSVTYTQTQVVVTIYHTFSNSGTAGLGLSHTHRHQSLLPPITPSLTQVQQILFCHTQTHTHTHRHTHTHTQSQTLMPSRAYTSQLLLHYKYRNSSYRSCSLHALANSGKAGFVLSLTRTSQVPAHTPDNH